MSSITYIHAPGLVMWVYAGTEVPQPARRGRRSCDRLLQLPLPEMRLLGSGGFVGWAPR